jgi:hypothetical protein
MTLARWFIIPAAILVALFLPFFLLPLVLILTFILTRELLSFVCVAAPQFVGTENRTAVRPRSPPLR